MWIPIEVDAVVFDCDGLLAETEGAWTRAETAIFREHGHGFGPKQKQILIGGSLASGGDAMAEYFGLPGARDVAEILLHRGIPIAVASNSPRRFVDAALNSAGLADLFEVIVSSDDVERAKPAADLYLSACARLVAEPERSVAFEDSRTGVASARAAMMFVIGVPSAPGAVLDAHVTYDSLTHSELRSWVAAVRQAGTT